MLKLTLIILFSGNFIVSCLSLKFDEIPTEPSQNLVKTEKFDLICELKKFFNSSKLKSGEKLKLLFDPFETFPEIEDVQEVIRTPKYLIANVAVVLVVAKVLAVFVVLIFMIYKSSFNSLFKWKSSIK